LRRRSHDALLTVRSNGYGRDLPLESIVRDARMITIVAALPISAQPDRRQLLKVSVAGHAARGVA
jgi:hypothetical protein